MTIGLTWRRTARRIKRLKEGVLTISPDYSDATPDFLALLLMPESKIRLQVNVAVAAEAEGGRVGEGFQVAVCTGVVEQAF